MPKRTEETRRPCDVVVGGWPEGPLADDAGVRYVQLIARGVVKHLNGASVRAFSRAAGVSAMTVVALRDGTRYPDVRTLARMERAAGHSLLPDWRVRRDGARVTAVVSPSVSPADRTVEKTGTEKGSAVG